MTIRQALEELEGILIKEHAEWAVSHIAALSYTQLVLSKDKKLTADEINKFNNIKERLIKNEPIQYIMGTVQFIDIEIKTDKRALIPRPETELLAMDAAKCAEFFLAPKVLDIGCGTGCIGLFIKNRLKNADLTLIDISSDALNLAKENAELLGLKVNFAQADMLEMATIPCDVIVSNPPYIRTKVISELDLNVKDYEPHSALDGGEDGLMFYRALAKYANDSLSEKGTLLVEIGYDQGVDVKDIFSVYFRDVTVKKDFTGNPRIVIAKR